MTKSQHRREQRLRAGTLLKPARRPCCHAPWRVVQKNLGTPDSQTLSQLSAQYPACRLSFLDRELRCEVSHGGKQPCAINWLLQLHAQSET